MRLVTVTHFYPAHGGGLELVAERLVTEFAARGVSIDWFSSATDPAPSLDPASVHCIPVATWNIIEKLTQLPYPLWSPAVLPRLWRAIGKADAVHVHEHLYASSILAVLIARLRGRPVIITQHMGALGLPTRALTLLYETGAKVLGRLMFPLASRSVFISANVRRFFGRQNDPHAQLIFNGIDTERFTPGPPDRAAVREALGVPTDAKAALFVGRWVRKKGLHIIEQMAQQAPHVFWMIVGSGPEDPAAWKLPNVRVYGRVGHDLLPDYYRAADILVLPSSGEGFPLVVQEALCCGTGVLSTQEVASACPPASSMIRSRPTPRDGFDSEIWARALEEALANGVYLSARTTRTAAARALWSWDDNAERLLHLFQEALTGDAQESPGRRG